MLNVYGLLQQKVINTFSSQTVSVNRNVSFVEEGAPGDTDFSTFSTLTGNSRGQSYLDARKVSSALIPVPQKPAVHFIIYFPRENFIKSNKKTEFITEHDTQRPQQRAKIF